MKVLKQIGLQLTLCAGLVFGAPSAHAGIPVIDVANLLQALLEVLNSVTQITNQINQIRQLQAQIEAISGARNLGAVLNNLALQNYVPRDAVQVARAIESNGYGGLAGTARGMRDAQMVYNCLDLEDRAARIRCQSQLAMPYQTKAFMQDALVRAAGRTQQINGLMNQLNATADQKAVLEVQGRIAAENALLQHELTQIDLARGLAEAELRVAESRAREAQLEQVSRTGRLGDFMVR